jgi:hypothetical protein
MSTWNAESQRNHFTMLAHRYARFEKKTPEVWAFVEQNLRLAQKKAPLSPQQIRNFIADGAGHILRKMGLTVEGWE